MEEKTYDQLLEEISKRDARIDKLEQDLNEVISFNKTLLNRKDTTTGNSLGGENRKSELEKKLKGGLKYGN